MKQIQLPWAWMDPVVHPKQWKRTMKFGTWNVRSLCKSGSLTTVARELVRCKLDLVGVQKVRWNKGGPVRAGDYILFYGKGKKHHQLGTTFFVHHGVVSAVKRVEFVSNRMSHIVLRGCWCNIIVLDALAPHEKISGDSKDSFMRN